MGDGRRTAQGQSKEDDQKPQRKQEGKNAPSYNSEKIEEMKAVCPNLTDPIDVAMQWVGGAKVEKYLDHGKWWAVEEMDNQMGEFGIPEEDGEFDSMPGGAEAGDPGGAEVSESGGGTESAGAEAEVPGGMHGAPPEQIPNICLFTERALPDTQKIHEEVRQEQDLAAGVELIHQIRSEYPELLKAFGADLLGSDVLENLGIGLDPGETAPSTEQLGLLGEILGSLRPSDYLGEARIDTGIIPWLFGTQDDLGTHAGATVDAFDAVSSLQSRTPLPTREEFAAVTDGYVALIDGYLSAMHHTLEQHLSKGETEEVRKIVRDYVVLADFSLQMLFSDTTALNFAEAAQTDTSETAIAIGARGLHQLLSATVIPLKLKPPPIKVSKPKQAPESSPSNQTSTPSTPSRAPATPRQRPELSRLNLIKAYTREFVVAAAGAVHHAFYGKFAQLAKQYPELIDIVKDELDSPSGYLSKALGGLSGGREGVPIDPNEMTFLDLVRMWFFDLGETRLGTKGNELEFGDESATTLQIRAHKSVKEFEDRAAAEMPWPATEPMVGRLHYGTAAFFNAIASNDIVLNTLGSFTIVAERTGEHQITYKLINNLSLESGTRFMRDDSKPAGGAQNKMGVIKNRERGEGPLDLGGTVRCTWTWTDAR